PWGTPGPGATLRKHSRPATRLASPRRAPALAVCAGGSSARWSWAACPAAGAGKLYLPPPARYFGCRICHGLTYTSCQESHKYDRLYREAAQRLGIDAADVCRLLSRRGW